MDQDITFHTKLKQGQALNVSTVQRVHTPPFWKIGGNMGYNRSRFPAYEGNLTEVMKNLTKGANWFFWSLLETRNDKTNIAEFTPKDSTETKKVTRAYKELKELKLIKRTRRSYYIINPAAIQPRQEDYEEVFTLWVKENR